MLVNIPVNKAVGNSAAPEESLAALTLPPRDLSNRQSQETELTLTPLGVVGVWTDLPEWYNTPITLESAIEILTPPSVIRALGAVESDPRHLYNNIVSFDRVNSASTPPSSSTARRLERVALTPDPSEGAFSSGQLLRIS